MHCLMTERSEKEYLLLKSEELGTRHLLQAEGSRAVWSIPEQKRGAVNEVLS